MYWLFGEHQTSLTRLLGPYNVRLPFFVLLVGKLLLFRVFAGQLITGVYPLPPSEPREFTQSLAGPLAGVSLRCGSCPHDAVTRLSFQTESLRALVILSDRVLSVVTINESVTPEVVQVCNYDVLP